MEPISPEKIVFSNLRLCILQNAAGHDYNSCYGFGVLNAMSLIEKAKNWEHVGPQLRHEVQGDLRSRQSGEIKSNDDLTLRVSVQ